MNETVYDESHPYDGKDFMDVLRAMDAHQLKLTLKSAYRKEGEKVKKITVELYPELFARRTINIPGVLMGAVYGASTADHEMYEKAVDMVKADGIEVEIVEGHEPSIQKVTILTDKGNTVQVDTLNRGGGRVVLRNAVPSLEQAVEAAKRLGIVMVEA